MRQFPTIDAIVDAQNEHDAPIMRRIIAGEFHNDAEGLADQLTSLGHPISATTIKAFRRTLGRATHE